MFKFFRRYQKSFIIFGGVILMFVFTIGDSLTGWLGRNQENQGGRQASDVAVTWDGGSLTEGELDTLVQKRLMVHRFVTQVRGVGYQLAESKGLEQFQRPVVPVGGVGEDWTRNHLEADVLQDYILAQKGEEMGIRVTDAAVKKYISELGFGQLGGDEVQGIISNLMPGSAATGIIFDALRHELTAAAVQQVYGAGFTANGLLAAELPVDRWEQWRQVNDRLAIEAAAIDPSSSLIDVKDPTDDELREYYEKYKNNIQFPREVLGVQLTPPAPGFRVPRKIRVQYLRANFNEFVDRFAAEVTDEEIAEYYEENKVRFTKAASFDDLSDLDLSDTDDTEATEATDEAAADADDAESEEMQEDSAEGDSEDTTEESAEAGTDEAAEEEKPAGDSEEPADDTANSDESADGDSPDSDVPDVTEEPATAEEPATEPADGEESSAAKPRSPFRLVALQEETDEAAGEADTSGEESTEPEASDDAAADSEESAGENNNEESAEESEEMETEYQPLEEVADKIRRNIAEERFFNEIDATMEEIAGKLNPAFKKYLNAKLDADALDEEPPTPPEALADLSALAKEYSLEYEESGELDGMEMQDSSIGRTEVYQKYDGNPLWRVLFGADVELYEPILAGDVGRFGDRYLVMKTSDEPSRVPSFEEVKAEVAKAWKQAEAAKLALEKAEKLAEKVQKADISLTDYFADDANIEVVRTEPFSQLSTGEAAFAGGPANYKLPEPEGLESIGPEFLQSVFKLKEGEVKALLNFEQSKVYLVKIADQDESAEQLRADFLQQTNNWPGRRMFRDNSVRIKQQSVLGSVIEDLNVEWQRPEETAEETAEDEAA